MSPGPLPRSAWGLGYEANHQAPAASTIATILSCQPLWTVSKSMSYLPYAILASIVSLVWTAIYIQAILRALLNQRKIVYCRILEYSCIPGVHVDRVTTTRVTRPSFPARYCKRSLLWLFESGNETNPWCHTCEETYQALCILHATENGTSTYQWNHISCVTRVNRFDLCCDTITHLHFHSSFACTTKQV